jgi:glycosyltransferase involved in cell wall biosynthesis
MAEPPAAPAVSPVLSPVLSVVIPCLNEERTLGRQLEALAVQEADFPWEVVVADNGSTDRTVEVARGFAGRLPALNVVHEPRRGRHHACNAGAAAARGELLVFVDGDDEALPGFLEAMRRGLAVHPVAAGRLEHNRLAPGAAHFGCVQTDGLREGTGFLPAASGGCLGVRREVFEAVAGFRNAPAFAEDVDLSWRLQLAGYPIAFVPEAAVAARQRSDLRHMYRQHRNFGEAYAHLYKLYRRRGMPGRPLGAAAAEWWKVLRGALRARSGDEKARLVRRAGRAVGRLRGSLKHRVLYL